MEECSLPKARPISCNVCPDFQRRHTSLFCSAESPNRFPCFINTTFENSFIPDGVASTARTGHLPAGSWLIPPGPVDEHPPASMCEGENWTVSVLNAVMQGPDWNSTVVFMTWDDFGGFYDHVAPPQVD